MKFIPTIPFASKTPTVTVDAGMPPGSYLFRLEVEDESGNKSRPDERVVVIERPGIVFPARPDIVIPIRPEDKTLTPKGGGGKESRASVKSGRDKAERAGRVSKTKAGKKVGDDDEPS